ncbi:MAG: hypothetical protein Q7R71_00190 [bacterium]|nr:hypothetical protein [bacterium]
MARQTTKTAAEKERERIQEHYRWMNFLPVRLPSAKLAFGHIPAKIDVRAYDQMPTKLGNPDKYFANFPTHLGDPEKAFAHIGN